eukprot:RCo035177
MLRAVAVQLAVVVVVCMGLCLEAKVVAILNNCDQTVDVRAVCCFNNTMSNFELKEGQHVLFHACPISVQVIGRLMEAQVSDSSDCLSTVSGPEQVVVFTNNPSQGFCVSLVNPDYSVAQMFC